MLFDSNNKQQMMRNASPLDHNIQTDNQYYYRTNDRRTYRPFCYNKISFKRRNNDK